jgi:hypothetical protein
MSKFGIFNNGKVTSSIVLYTRGVPQRDRRFAWIACQNFSMIKQIARFYKRHGKM